MPRFRFATNLATSHDDSKAKQTTKNHERAKQNEDLVDKQALQKDQMVSLQLLNFFKFKFPVLDIPMCHPWSIFLFILRV